MKNNYRDVKHVIFEKLMLLIVILLFDNVL